MAVTLTRGAGLVLGAALIQAEGAGVDGILFELSIGLYTVGPALSPDMVYADFTAAGFGGYAAHTAITFGTAYIDQTGKLQLTSPVQQWVCDADGDAEIIQGFYAWVPGTPNVLIFADSFGETITIEREGDGIAFAINFELDLRSHGTYLFSS